MTDTNKSTRVGGHSCRSFVQKLQPFHNKGSTLWGEWLSFSDGTPSLYVVYSYGKHWCWPLYANWRGVWFSNKDKFGRTTTKHSSQTHPLCPTVPLSKVDLEYLVLFGQPHDNDLVAAAKLRLLPDDLIPMAVAARIGGE